MTPRTTIVGKESWLTTIMSAVDDVHREVQESDAFRGARSPLPAYFMATAIVAFGIGCVLRVNESTFFGAPEFADFVHLALGLIGASALVYVAELWKGHAAVVDLGEAVMVLTAVVRSLEEASAPSSGTQHPAPARGAARRSVPPADN